MLLGFSGSRQEFLQWSRSQHHKQQCIPVPFQAQQRRPELCDHQRKSGYGKLGKPQIHPCQPANPVVCPIKYTHISRVLFRYWGHISICQSGLGHNAGDTRQKFKVSSEISIMFTPPPSGELDLPGVLTQNKRANPQHLQRP